MTYFTDGGVMTGTLGGKSGTPGSINIPETDGYGDPNVYGQIIKRAENGNEIIITAQGDTPAKIQSNGLQFGRPLGGSQKTTTYPGGLINFTPLPDQIHKEGYRFLGWFSDPEYRNKVGTRSYADPATGEEITVLNYTMPAGPGALYAKWESVENTAEFYDGLPGAFGGDGKYLGRVGIENGGRVAMPTYYQSNETVSGKGSFLGWNYMLYRSANAARSEAAYPFEMTVYNPVHNEYHGLGSYALTDLGEAVNNGEYDESDYERGERVPVLLIYANWKTTGFTVTYDKGSGTGTAPEEPGPAGGFNLDVKVQVKDKSDTMKPPTNEFFIGWTLSVNGMPGSDLYLPGSELKISGDTALTAQYAAAVNIVNVSYNSNADPSAGASSPNATQSVSTEKGRTFHPVTADYLGWAENGAGKDANEGKEFLGWSTNPYANLPDSPQTYIANNNSLILYAVWKVKPDKDAVTDFAKRIADPERPGQYADDAAYPAGTEELTFKLSFTVPEDVRGWREVAIEDILPEELSLHGSLKDAVTVTVNGADPSPAGTLTQDGQSLRYTFDPHTPWTAYKNKEIAMTIRTVVKSGFGGKTVNKGRLLFNPNDEDDGDELEAEPPETEIAYPESVTDLTKRAVSTDGTALPEKAAVETTRFPADTREITYEISFGMSADTTGYMSVIVQDILPDYLELDGELEEAVKLTADGERVTINPGNTVYEDNIVSHNFAARSVAEWKTLENAAVVMTVKARVKEAYAGIGLEFTNKGRVLVNSDMTDRDDPLDPDGEDGPSAGVEDGGFIAPPPPPEGVKNLTKRAVSADGTALPESAPDGVTQFPANTSKITYKISFLMPNDTRRYERLIVQDILPEYLEPDGDVTDAVTVTINDAGVPISPENTRYANRVVSCDFGTLTPADRRALENATVVMTVKAKVKAEYAGRGLDMTNIGRVLVNTVTDRNDAEDPDGDGPSAITEDPGTIKAPGGGGAVVPPPSKEDDKGKKEEEGGDGGDGGDDGDDDDYDDDDKNVKGDTNAPNRPTPNAPGHTLIPTDDGRYIEIDEDGTPLGEWHYDENSDTWIFDEYPPLAGNLPQTGSPYERRESPMTPILLFGLIALAGLLYSIGRGKRANGDRYL
jgi:fimbrial isopeptide formation D2 family protein